MLDSSGICAILNSFAHNFFLLEKKAIYWDCKVALQGALSHGQSLLEVHASVYSLPSAYIYRLFFVRNTHTCNQLTQNMSIDRSLKLQVQFKLFLHNVKTKNNLMYTACTELVIQQTICFIFWIKWYKNESFWQRITCIPGV